MSDPNSPALNGLISEVIHFTGVHRYPSDAYEVSKMLLDIYWIGYSDGYNDGYNDGYEESRDNA